MSDVFEKLGYFYLGKHIDPQTGELRDDDLLLYKSKDLTTHGVIVGMTGSGKTGLGVALIEEAVIDGIPVIAIDPKGDLGNLMLTFPSFDPDEFEPCVQETDAAARGLSTADFARQQAELWRTGLASWGQDGERIAAFERAADRCIYTPGSTAGRPLSILASFKAPSARVASDSELLGERVAASTSGLLSLIGIDTDPASSREYALLTNILSHFWREGRDLDLAALMNAVQSPPFERIGMMGVETFFPEKDRFDFTLRLNHLLANPGFQTWLEGDPLDAQRLFYTADGGPRLSIISIAHLSDAERMFAVTALLNEIIGWMRSQPGTSTLRALLYVDEMFGFLPPVANPPSKRLFLTLLKQARAFGLGTVLSTQNPVDLDYKALSNAGTWFIGRLQTERDRARLLDGMATLDGGGPADLADLGSRITGLKNRQFVLHTVHGADRAMFGTRWVMSYLAGPMTRDQIRRLSEGAAANGHARKSEEGDVRQSVAAPGESSAVTPDRSAPFHSADDVALDLSLTDTKPILPSGIVERFAAHDTRVGDSGADSDRGSQQRDEDGRSGSTRGRIRYHPVLFFRARASYFDRKRGIQEESEWLIEAEVPGPDRDPDWSHAHFAELDEHAWQEQPAPNASFEMPPGSLQDPSRIKAWGRSLESWIERNHAIELLESRLLGMVADPDESEAAFRARVNLRAREERDREIEEVEKSFAARLRRVEDRLQRAQHAVEREAQQVEQAKVSSTIAVGQTILSALLGRKALSRGTMSRAGTAARSASRIAKESADVDRAREKAERIEDELESLSQDLEAALAEVRSRFEEDESFETIRIRPRASETAVTEGGILWKPM